MSTPDPSALAAIKPAARVRDLVLRGASLREVQAPGLRGENLDFRRADLTGAGLPGARLTECDLSDATLESADLSEATLRACRLGGVRAAGAVLTRARLEDSDAAGADFSGADLTGARLTESSFARAGLRDARLDEASGEGVDFRGADLAGTSLAAARLADADFRGADLSGASLARGSFQGADFRGAILEATDWKDAEWTGARFDLGATPAEKGTPAPNVEPGLDAATAGVEPMVAWVENLLKGAVSTFPPTPTVPPAASTPADLRRMIEDLQRALTTRGVQADGMLCSFQQVLESLETMTDNEPPETWKPALEELVARLPRGTKDPDFKDVLNLFLARL